MLSFVHETLLVSSFHKVLVQIGKILPSRHLRLNEGAAAAALGAAGADEWGCLVVEVGKLAPRLTRLCVARLVPHTLLLVPLGAFLPAAQRPSNDAASQHLK